MMREFKGKDGVMMIGGKSAVEIAEEHRLVYKQFAGVLAVALCNALYKLLRRSFHRSVFRYFRPHFCLPKKNFVC